MEFIESLNEANQLNQFKTTSLLMRLLKDYSVSFYVEPIELSPFIPPSDSSLAPMLCTARKVLEHQRSLDALALQKIIGVLTRCTINCCNFHCSAQQATIGDSSSFRVYGLRY